MLIDTHAHLDDKQFNEDLEGILKRAKESDVSTIVTVSSAPGSIKNTIELTKKYQNVYGAVGLHPHDAKHFSDKIESDILNALKEKKIVAIGEIGLDFHYNFSTKDEQFIALKRQLKIAKEKNLPIIVHDRESTEELIKIFENDCNGKVNGIMHCFTGDAVSVKRFLKLGMYISFSGILTFPKAQSIRDAAKVVPLDRILVETDSPYLAPVPLRGKRNEPSFVKHTAEVLANILGLSLEELSRITTENAKRIFKISN